MNSNTFIWYTGLACGAVGTTFRAYVLIRAKGLRGFTTRNSVVIGSYRELVKEGRAPLWPLIMSYVFITLGISMMAGAILFGKN